jgi:hypothetical protein
MFLALKLFSAVGGREQYSNMDTARKVTSTNTEKSSVEIQKCVKGPKHVLHDPPRH